MEHADVVSVYTHRLRVFSEDTDCYGIVWHGAYLAFFSRARVEWIRALGFTLPALKAEHDVLLPVHSIDIQYRKPAYLDEELSITVEPINLKAASMLIYQQVRNQQNDTLCQCTTRLACTNQALQPKRLPSRLLQEMRAHEQ